MGPVILALEQVQRMDANTLPVAVALLMFGIVALIALVWQERRNTSPLIPPKLFQQPSIWRSDGLAACHGAALVSLITFLPIYLRAVRGASPAETGLLLLPLTFGIGLGSMITGQIVTRTGRTAVFPTYGYMAATVGLLIVAFWMPHLSTSELPWVFFTIALCMGTVMGVVQVTVQAVSGQRMLGTGAAMVQFSRSVGAAFGTATVAAVLFSFLALDGSRHREPVRHHHRPRSGRHRVASSGTAGRDRIRDRQRLSSRLRHHRDVHELRRLSRVVAADAPGIAIKTAGIAGGSRRRQTCVCAILEWLKWA